MYGWRAKIGLIKPTLRGKSFALWFTTAPEGVEILPTYVGYTRGDRDDFDTGLERIAILADELKAAGADVICVSGGPPFLLRGRAFEVAWAAQLESHLGIPVVGPLSPHAAALLALGASRVVTVTYYRDELNAALATYLRECSIETTVAAYTGDKEEPLYSVPLRDVERLTWMDVYRHVREAVSGTDAEAIYVHGHGWDAGRAIMPLEIDTGLPVVFGPEAEMVATYRRIGVAFTLHGGKVTG
jgi:maleate cis-trans isomerase